MANIDITTTATIRPDILRETLSSFSANLLSGKHNYRLILNVDPIGEPNKTQDDVVQVANSFFPNIVVNSPSEHNFTKAVIWCWHQTKSEYVFHLEDDWIMLRKIDINHMLLTMNKHEEYSSFALSQYVLDKGIKLPPAPVRPRERICLNPTFIRHEFIKKAVDMMRPDLDPERQLGRRGFIAQKIKLARHAVYTEYGYKPLIRDIGRKWMKECRLYRKTKGVHAWVSTKENK